MKQPVTPILVFACFLFQAGCTEDSSEKFFSGSVEYSYSYQTDSLNTDSLARVRPAKGIFRYDQNNYQSRFAGKDTVTYYYSGKLNKCISQTGTRQDYACEDYGAMTDSVLSYDIRDTDEKILGYTCRILELKKRNSSVVYYVTSAVKIAPATYQRHRSYNWDVYGEKAGGGLILKLEHRFRTFTMTGLATSLKKEEAGFSALELDESRMAGICQQ